MTQHAVAPISRELAASYAPYVSELSREHLIRADAVADAVCRRRLLNAFLAVAAAWLLFATQRLDSRVAEEGVGLLLGGLAIAVSVGAIAFAMWAATAGDQRTWRGTLRRVRDVETLELRDTGTDAPQRR